MMKEYRTKTTMGVERPELLHEVPRPGSRLDENVTLLP
jgi:hypothetical protein